MRSKRIWFKYWLLVTLLLGGVDALSQVTACDGGALTGSEIVAPAPAIGHQNNGSWSVISTPPENTITFADASVFNTAISGFKSGYSYDFVWTAVPSGTPYSETVVVELDPAVQTVTSANQCAPSSISLQLNSSENGVEYVLQRDGVDVISWTSASDGDSHTFGSYSGIGVYSVVARGCNGDVDMTGSYSISAVPTIYNITTLAQLVWARV